jgi:acyl-CoA synthetase (AMP-forming)/AMP-acid ligase II
VTHVHATPLLFERILDLIDDGARHSLRGALIGGAGLDPSLRRRASALGIRVVTYYGAAELSFVAADADGAGMRVLADVQSRLDDGRLWVRSPYLAAGYAGDERGPFRVDEEGWASVGDLAAIGADGILTLRGRSDGAILTAAATVVPEEVEAVLRAVPGVRQAVVFGSAARGNDALVTAVLELDPGIQVTVPQLRERMRSSLTLAHRPRLWYAMDPIPLTATGKPARGRVQDAVANGEVRRLGQ